jgi:hypothetical protein
VPEAEILEDFEATLDLIAIDTSLSTRIAAERNVTLTSLRRTRRDESRCFIVALDELQEREARLFDLLVLRFGALDAEAYKRQLVRLRDERTTCTDQLARANEQLDDRYLLTANEF